MGGVAIASALAFMIPSAPAFAQTYDSVSKKSSGYRAAGASPASILHYQHHVYAPQSCGEAGTGSASAPRPWAPR